MKARENEAKKHIGYQIAELSRTIQKAIDKQMEQFGISPMESWIILHLYHVTEGNVYQKDIEKAFHLSKSTATGLLQGIERKGYLVRESETEDIRKKRIILTEKGRSLQLDIMKQLDRFEDGLRDNLPLEEEERFLQSLDQIRRNAENIPDFIRKDRKNAEKNTGRSKRI